MTNKTVKVERALIRSRKGGIKITDTLLTTSSDIHIPLPDQFIRFYNMFIEFYPERKYLCCAKSGKPLLPVHLAALLKEIMLYNLMSDITMKEIRGSYLYRIKKATQYENFEVGEVLSREKNIIVGLGKYKHVTQDDLRKLVNKMFEDD